LPNKKLESFFSQTREKNTPKFNFKIRMRLLINLLKDTWFDKKISQSFFTLYR